MELAYLVVLGITGDLEVPRTRSILGILGTQKALGTRGILGILGTPKVLGTQVFLAILAQLVHQQVQPLTPYLVNSIIGGAIFHLFTPSPFHLYKLFHPFTLSPFHPFTFPPFHLYKPFFPHQTSISNPSWPKIVFGNMALASASKTSSASYRAL